MWNSKKTLLPLAALGLVATQSPSAPGQDLAPSPQDAAMAAKVQLLESRIQTLEAYVETQSKAAQALNAAIDSAVAEGYTAGINYKSREILVQGWKAANKAQMDTGSGKAKQADSKGSRRGR